MKVIVSGSFTTSLKTLQGSQGRGNPFPCINPKKMGKKKYVDSGKVFVQQLVVERVPSFLEYIQAGIHGYPHKQSFFLQATTR